MTIHPITPQSSRMRATRIWPISSQHYSSPSTKVAFQFAAEAWAYQCRARARIAYSSDFDFGWKPHDLAMTARFWPGGVTPWVAPGPQLWCRADEAAAQMSWAGAISAVALVADLPSCCSIDVWYRMIEAFVRNEVNSLGLVVDVAVHDPHLAGMAGPVHVHMLFSCREIGAGNFATFIKASKEPATWSRWRCTWQALFDAQIGLAAAA